MKNSRQDRKVVLRYADGTTRERKLVVCDTVVSRMVGMLRERDETVSDVYQIVPCNGIHTLFMAFPIDVVFTDHTGRIIDCRNVPPFRFFSRSSAFMVFEGIGLLRKEVLLERVEVE